MDTILVTGGAGLVGSECCRNLVKHGYEVVSVDNYGRGEIFGEEADTAVNVDKHLDNDKISHHAMDIRSDEIHEIVAEVDGIIHTAAQPSHPKSIDIPSTG